MDILKKFELLTEQAIFCSNKQNTLQSIGLNDILNERNNQQIRATLSNNKEHFADMTYCY